MNDGTVTERAEGEHDKGKEVILPPRQSATKRMNDRACNDDAGENEKRVLPKNKKQRVDTREEETKKAILLLLKVWMSRSKRFTEENNMTSAFLSSLTTDNVREKTTEENRWALSEYFKAKVDHCSRMKVELEQAKKLAEEALAMKEADKQAKELEKYTEMKTKALDVWHEVNHLPWGE